MNPVLERLVQEFTESVVEIHEQHGDATAVVTGESLTSILRFLRDAPELRFSMLVDLTAVDFLTYPGREDGPRFEVVYHLMAPDSHRRVRIKTRIDERDCRVPSSRELWPVADWLEREVWDMFGITFTGHPNLKRLLMYPEFQGHPLRKDYPFNKEQPLVEQRPAYDAMAGVDRGLTLHERSLDVHGGSHP
ncbi:NADH-quinone oxidoreductase subunit C [bacterium]|nr:NADH-quinone oxidoreductase subunit C [candidate division CSSED10-310 bacterium]